jgi:hypothetical protein
MATTKQQIVESALARLGINAPGQPVGSDDFVFSLDELNATLAALASTGLTVTVTVAPADKDSTVDDSLRLGLRDLLAFNLAPAFQQQQDARLYAFAIGQIQSILEVQDDFEPVSFTDY